MKIAAFSFPTDTKSLQKFRKGLVLSSFGVTSQAGFSYHSSAAAVRGGYQQLQLVKIISVKNFVQK